MLALVEPAQVVDELRIKVDKITAAEADRAASEAAREESWKRYESQKRVYAGRATSEEEVRLAFLQWIHYRLDEVHKAQDVKVATSEFAQTETLRDFHAICSKINGQVRNISKHRGDAVHNLDTLMTVQDACRLRIEARVEYQHRQHLKVGDRVAVEFTQSVSPNLVRQGHLQDITGVAVSAAGEILSSSNDGTVRVWNRRANQPRLILPHQVAVRCVACAPKANLCLSGGADGIGRIWDLGGDVPTSPLELRDEHEGHREAIHCVAFSGDGRWCATGGDDKAICLWQVDDGKLLKRFPADLGHHGAVTSVQFVPGEKEGELWLISAGQGDKTLLAWPLSADGTPGTPVNFGRREGSVAALGARADGKEVLFDSVQGKELRLLSLPDQTLQGVLTLGGSTNFTTLAQFSPDGKLILTACGSEGRLQLWRAPTSRTRGHELRQLAWPGDRVTCGAFAPDGSFLVAGTRDHNVLIWDVPAKEEVETQPTAEIVLVDNDLESGRWVRVHAEVDNRWFQLTSRSLARLRAEKLPEALVKQLESLKDKEFTTEKSFKEALAKALPADDLKSFQDRLMANAEKPGPLLPGNTAALVVYPK